MILSRFAMDKAKNEIQKKIKRKLATGNWQLTEYDAYAQPADLQNLFWKIEAKAK